MRFKGSQGRGEIIDIIDNIDKVIWEHTLTPKFISVEVRGVSELYPLNKLRLVERP